MKKVSDAEIKMISKKILFYVDDICKNNNIRYYINFGTLIGAVRHKGFIPWDDDIDICMPRSDYEKFLSIMKSDQNYRLISMENDPDYYFCFSRICDKNTILKLKGMREIHNLGVFIDVFPIDNAPELEKIDEWYDEFENVYKKIHYTIPNSAKYTDKSIITLMKRIKKLPLRLLYNPKKFSIYKEQLTEIMNRYNDKSTNKNVIIMGTPYMTRTTFPKSFFEDSIEMNFEDGLVMAPKSYDALLKKIYGNYMKLPDIADRKSLHHFIAYWRDNK